MPKDHLFNMYPKDIQAILILLAFFKTFYKHDVKSILNYQAYHSLNNHSMEYTMKSILLLYLVEVKQSTLNFNHLHLHDFHHLIIRHILNLNYLYNSLPNFLIIYFKVDLLLIITILK